MGVTYVDIPILKRLIPEFKIKSVIELGAQMNYDQPLLPAPYMENWYRSAGVERYLAIDLNGENNSLKLDLAKPITSLEPVDLVTDFGTSEHISEEGMDYEKGTFSWNAIYNCWKNKFNLCRVGGIIFSENPKTGNWPGHGFNYYTVKFYTDLAEKSGLTIMDIQQIPAMENYFDGWNVLCIMRKINEKFPTLEEFKTFDLRGI